MAPCLLQKNNCGPNRCARPARGGVIGWIWHAANHRQATSIDPKIQTPARLRKRKTGCLPLASLLAGMMLPPPPGRQSGLRMDLGGHRCHASIQPRLAWEPIQQPNSVAAPALWKAVSLDRSSIRPQSHAEPPPTPASSTHSDRAQPLPLLKYTQPAQSKEETDRRITQQDHSRHPQSDATPCRASSASSVRGLPAPGAWDLDRIDDECMHVHQ